MAFIHPLSCECTKSELDLFSVPTTQTSIEKTSYTEYHPISSITKGSPIEFQISGDGDHYIDLAESMLYVKAKIEKADGTAYVAADNIQLVPSLLHSLFSQV